MNWLSIKEKLPNIEESIDIWLTDGYVIIRGTLFGGEITTDECCNDYLKEITYWIKESDIPLP